MSWQVVQGILKGYTLVRWVLIMSVRPSCCPCCSFTSFNVNIQCDVIHYGIFICLCHCTLFFLVFCLFSVSYFSLTIPVMLLLCKMIFWEAYILKLCNRCIDYKFWTVYFQQLESCSWNSVETNLSIDNILQPEFYVEPLSFLVLWQQLVGKLLFNSVDYFTKDSLGWGCFCCCKRSI